MKSTFLLLFTLFFTIPAFTQNEFLQSKNNYGFDSEAIVKSEYRNVDIFITNNTAWGSDEKLVMKVRFNKIGMLRSFDKVGDYSTTFQSLGTGTFKYAKLAYNNELLKSAKYTDQYDKKHNVAFESNGKYITKQLDTKVEEESNSSVNTDFSYNEEGKLILMVTKNIVEGTNLGTFYQIYSYPSSTEMVISHGSGKLKKKLTKNKSFSSKQVFNYNKKGQIITEESYSDYEGERKEVRLDFSKVYLYDGEARLVKTVQTPAPDLGSKYGDKPTYSKKTVIYNYEGKSKLINNIEYILLSDKDSSGKSEYNKHTISFKYSKD